MCLQWAQAQALPGPDWSGAGSLPAWARPSTHVRHTILYAHRLVHGYVYMESSCLPWQGKGASQPQPLVWHLAPTTRIPWMVVPDSLRPRTDRRWFRLAMARGSCSAGMGGARLPKKTIYRPRPRPWAQARRLPGPGWCWDWQPSGLGQAMCMCVFVCMHNYMCMYMDL